MNAINPDKTDVLFIFNKRIDSGGKTVVSVGLFNSASFCADYLNSIGISAKVQMCDDSNDVDRQVTKHNPKMVIVEALWIKSKKFLELLSIKRHAERKWIVRIHSKIPFLANEGNAIEMLTEYRDVSAKYKNFFVSANDEQTNRELKDVVLGNRYVYLPNLFSPLKTQDSFEKKKEDAFLDVASFGAIRPFKNQLEQAIASIKLANKKNKTLRYHVNASRQEQGGDRTYKNLVNLFKGQDKHTLINHPWMDREELVKTMRQCDIGIQVSISETFNIVAADMVSCGIPTVGSEAIEWLPFFSQAQWDDSDSIAEYMDFALKFRWLTIKFTRCCLEKWNKKAKKVWRKEMRVFISNCR